MTEELTKKIQEHFDTEKEEKEIQASSKKVLLELLKACENHNISKEGLIKEFEAGIREEYLNNVCWANGEAKDLDLERMAMIGKKRRQLQKQGAEVDGEAQDWPVKLVDAELEV